jgi:hypothetical protein
MFTGIQLLVLCEFHFRIFIYLYEFHFRIFIYLYEFYFRTFIYLYLVYLISSRMYLIKVSVSTVKYHLLDIHDLVVNLIDLFRIFSTLNNYLALK